MAATAGEVVSYDGKPVVTYYFSTSGGRTENVENAFLGAVPAPYLTSVEDPYDDVSPRHTWMRQMSLRSAQRRLGSLVKGSLTRIRVLRRGRSPRVVAAQVVGTGGRTAVSGPTLRRKLGLYDTWARFTVITATARRGDGNAPSGAPRRPGGSGRSPDRRCRPVRPRGGAERRRRHAARPRGPRGRGQLGHGAALDRHALGRAFRRAGGLGGGVHLAVGGAGPVPRALCGRVRPACALALTSARLGSARGWSSLVRSAVALRACELQH